jgi:hypothetical protein
VVQVLDVRDNGDGTSTVTVATVTHGQAVVTVPTDKLGHPDVEQLYAHAADITGSPYAADRRSGRDRRRQASRSD